MTDTELICRNVIYRFWSKHYKYEDIAKVVYCSMGPSGIRISEREKVEKSSSYKLHGRKRRR